MECALSGKRQYMTKRLVPIQKIEPDKVEVGNGIEVHADRLASFKATVSRYNKDKGTSFKFVYSGVKNDYFTATRTA